ncbi:MAG: sigma-70 family RNA polymerase sigma factor [Acidobacteriota bacterium]
MPTFPPSNSLPAPAEITAWLEQWSDGDARALDAIVPEIYHELRRIARQAMAREGSGHVLSTTALVHEAYVRLLQQHRLAADDREEFFAIASITMRRILVDHARRARRQKRGGGAKALPLEDVEVWLPAPQRDELIELDSALDRLAELDARAALVVQHRFFIGLGLEEIAELLEVSVKTVQRDWTFARAWLRDALRGGAEAFDDGAAPNDVD